MQSPPDSVGVGILFRVVSAPRWSVRSFVRTYIVTRISHGWLEQISVVKVSRNAQKRSSGAPNLSLWRSAALNK